MHCKKNHINKNLMEKMNTLLKSFVPVELLKAPEHLKSFTSSHRKSLEKISSILGDTFSIPENYKLGDLRKELEHVRVGNKATWKIFNISLADISPQETAACTPHIKKLVNEVKRTNIDTLFDLIPTNYIDILQSQKEDLYLDIKEIMDDFITIILNHHKLMDDHFEFILAVVNDDKFRQIYEKATSSFSFDASTLSKQAMSIFPQLMPMLTQVNVILKNSQ